MVRFSILITAWYRQNARELPWRNTRDPYLIWLSEIILQQTRVEQGLPYYLKFAKNYPKIADLANAKEDDVLKDWQGLGYYSRARNLQTAAKQVIDTYKGEFPQTYDEIINLKGIGDYTASAISSFAFDEVKAVVDGNVYRLLSRYLDIHTAIDSTIGKKEFKKAAEELIDPNNPAEHNQAIMEMGALICTPKNPNCQECPLIESCVGYEKRTFLELPKKANKIKVRNRYFHYLLIEKDGKTFINKRGPKDVWQGLYDFPLIEQDDAGDISAESQSDFGLKNLEKVAEMKHVLSHQRIYASFWKADVKGDNSELKLHQKIDIKDIADYPMPQLLIRYLESSANIW
ncbi:MAG: A/G-specific adenine glycosylase [Arenicella sp.]|jgi:A/G-specific adenine glycosylase